MATDGVAEDGVARDGVAGDGVARDGVARCRFLRLATGKRGNRFTLKKVQKFRW